MTGSAERALPRLHLVTNDEVLRDPSFGEVAAEVLRRGGDRVALHLRGHGLTGREMWTHAERLAAESRASGSWLVVNDRVDVALACGADAVQLGRESIRPEDAARMLGPGVRIGVSVHDVDEARAAAESGADFLLAGTLFKTDTHPEGEPRGARWLAELVGFGLPVIGIGGIDPSRVREVLAAGASGVAVIRAVWAHSDPAAAVGVFLDELG